jgi:diguanylate cyclase (GGDEF)-like protein
MLVENVAILLSPDLDAKSFTVHSAQGYDDCVDISSILLDADAPIIRYLEKDPNPHEFSTMVESGELFDDLKTLELLQADLLVPMMVKDSLNGILLVGGKINGGSFSTDERDFLKGLSRFGAIAVENSRLYHMATMDRMTKLYVHHYFQERLGEEIVRSIRYGKPLSLIITDIDHFKIFNDTHGHQVGDIVLKETARLMRDSIRSTDFPARYGGEEFAVILPETELPRAIEVAQRIRKVVEEHKYPGSNQPLHVTISVGVAQFDPARDIEKRQLVERTDKSLYGAKHAGRNRVAAAK